MKACTCKSHEFSDCIHSNGHDKDAGDRGMEAVVSDCNM
jgi:hypothetical protein